MDNDLKPEIKEAVKTDKELRKEKWKKFVFGEPKKYDDDGATDKKDIVWYTLAFVFLVLGLLPVLLRNFDTNYDPDKYKEKEKTPVVSKKTYQTLSCNKEFGNEKDALVYKFEVISQYEDKKIQSTELKYSFVSSLSPDIDINNFSVIEYETISSLGLKGVTTNKGSGVLTINIDYNENEKLRKEDALIEHNKALQLQHKSYLDQSYSCVLMEVEDGSN